MANLSSQIATTAGIALTTTASTTVTGDTFTSAPNKVLVVANTTGAPINLTFVTPNTDADGNAIADKVVAIPANATRYFGLGSGQPYVASDGKVTVIPAAVGINLSLLQSS